MKRLLLSFCLFSIVLVYGYSQSLSISNIHGTIAPNAIMIQEGSPDSAELITYFNVTNTSGSSVDVLCKKVELTMLDSTEITMCWAGGCYPASTNISPYSQAIGAGLTNNEFVGHYTQIAFHHFKPGESVVRWVFYDRSNVNDSASVTVKYTSYPLGVDETAARQSSLSNVYPNPASANATCSYSIPAGSQGTILVRDLLGSTMQTLSPATASGKVTIDAINLNDGIYFCSLLVDGKISQTKKLIVKH
ncbi:MAG: T9SS type A sorting domain-containing protein [Bacteroidetes bacterium]|nr:T9SS type A sorting domain-containing protein [Bacteroidota bacterium]